MFTGVASWNEKTGDAFAVPARFVEYCIPQAYRTTESDSAPGDTTNQFSWYAAPVIAGNRGRKYDFSQEMLHNDIEKLIQYNKEIIDSEEKK